MENYLTGALVTDAEGYIINKQSILRESAFHSVFDSLSNKSCNIGKQETICNDNGRNVLDHTFNEECIMNQPPIVLLEGEKHALLGVSQPEAHISTLPFSA
jgi:hypothetical protein